MGYDFRIGTLVQEGCEVDIGEGNIIEKDHFLIGERIAARLTTRRTEPTPYPLWIEFFRYNTVTGSWDWLYTYQPDRSYGCGSTAWIESPKTDIPGTYWVVFSDYNGIIYDKQIGVYKSLYTEYKGVNFYLESTTDIYTNTPFRVRAIVQNIGNRPDDLPILIYLDGQEYKTLNTGMIEPGGTVELSYFVNISTPGYHELEVLGMKIQVNVFDVPQTPQMTITSITATMDNINSPRSRTITVIGSGSGSYQVKEGNVLIASRNLVNGFDIFNIDNIQLGTHTYCVSGFSVCDTFVVDELLPPSRWSCSNNCNEALQVGAYDSKASCQAGCAQPPPGGNCPKGEKYLANGWEIWTGCPEGYTIRKGGELGLPFIDDYYCVCQTGEAGKDNEGWVKYVPYAIGAYLLSSLFGGRK